LAFGALWTGASSYQNMSSQPLLSGKDLGAIAAKCGDVAYTPPMTTLLVCTFAALTALLHAAVCARAAAKKNARRQLTPAHS
jgi:hypothetical protein